LIYVGNLIDAIVACIDRPEAAGQTYLVSDGEDISTPELIRRVAAELGKAPRLFPCPPMMMRLAGKLTGRFAEVERLLGSLTVDTSKIQKELGWKAPYTLEQGLRDTAEWFLKRQI
jgi:nucleoside-diphosphate-sugar epimerase